MDISTHCISVSKTARYTTYGRLSAKTKFFWIALHGSNMLCEQMLYKFKDFDQELHFIVAPEGLSRFYQNGFSGDVVAAWMTSRDRLAEIDDFSNYLSTLMAHFAPHISPSCLTLGLGFSQGGTTLFRWLHNTKVDIDFVIGYSCWIPEDIDLKKSKTDLNTIQLVYSYGLQDQFLTEDKITAIKSIIKKNELNVNMEAYKGDHRISRVQLKVLFDKYVKML